MDLPLTPNVGPYRADRAHSWCPQSIRRLAAMQANFSSTLYTHSSWTARCWRLTRFQENEYTYIKPATLLNNQVGAVSKEHTWAYQPVWLVLGQEYPWNSGRGRQRFMNHGDRHTLQCTGHAFMFTRLTSSTKSVCSSPCRDLDTRTSLRLPLVISRPKLAELLNTVMKLSGYWDIYTCTAYSRPSASILTIFSPSDVPTSTYKLISLFLVLMLIILVYFSNLFIDYIYGFSEHFSDHRFRVIFSAYKMSQFVGFSWTTPLNFIKSFWEKVHALNTSMTLWSVSSPRQGAEQQFSYKKLMNYILSNWWVSWVGGPCQPTCLCIQFSQSSRTLLGQNVSPLKRGQLRRCGSLSC